MAYTGWEISEQDRATLMGLFAPAYPDVIAHHVTFKPNTSNPSDIPDSAELVVVGFADDGQGVQALVVEVDGSTVRPDGGTYHITWSIDRSRGRKPVHSNDVIAQSWAVMPMRINIANATPKLF